MQFKLNEIRYDVVEFTVTEKVQVHLCFTELLSGLLQSSAIMKERKSIPGPNELMYINESSGTNT